MTRLEPHPIAFVPAGEAGKDPRRFEPALCICGESELTLWSHRLPGRLKLQFARNDVTTVLSEKEAANYDGPVIFVRADAVIDPPLINDLVRRPNLRLTGDSADGPVTIAITGNGVALSHAPRLLATSEEPAPGDNLITRSPGTLDISFWQGLRKREVPYAIAVSAENRSAVEWRMFKGTYKGATDLVTKHLWPRPAFLVTRFLAPTFVTPNMVTALSAVMVVLAFWWFYTGQYVPGIIAAWTMTFLDTVDGKLSRTTLTATKWGGIFDHGIDLIHPPFWYYAWGIGLASAGFHWTGPFFWSVIAVITGGYILQRAMEGIAIQWLGLEIHIWRPIDTLFRQITARRNPNLVIMTASLLIARPDWGLIGVAVWTAVCLVLHAIQLIHAFIHKAKHGPLTSWMSKRDDTA